jgi:hypothetical protein
VVHGKQIEESAGGLGVFLTAPLINNQPQLCGALPELDFVIVSPSWLADICLFTMQQLVQQRPQDFPVSIMSEMPFSDRDFISQTEPITPESEVPIGIALEILDCDGGSRRLEFKRQNESLGPRMKIIDYQPVLPIVDLRLVLSQFNVDSFSKSCHRSSIRFNS